MRVCELVLQGLVLGGVGRIRVRSAEGAGLVALCSESPSSVVFSDPREPVSTAALPARLLKSSRGLAWREGSGP